MHPPIDYSCANATCSFWIILCTANLPSVSFPARSEPTERLSDSTTTTNDGSTEHCVKLVRDRESGGQMKLNV